MFWRPEIKIGTVSRDFRKMLRWASRFAVDATQSRRFLTTSARRHAEIEIFIDNKPVLVEQGVALIQACEKAGVDIPRFCYHERLAVAGNCRMCLVELERSPKPIASCAMPAMPGMRIHTDTPLVKKAREGVMEFLLANHPLDCPVCDQGGECDLQDQSVRYGSDRSRFAEIAGKRAVEDKDFGPLIKTEMTRCIHCTRCVRFANEIAGMVELGTTGRGNDMQIGTYIQKTLGSELSGNIIDLCPVGALTSKPYAFTARPWELKRTESVDVTDAVGSAIRVDSRGVEVMRIIPRENDAVNEEWISDKTRFSYDGLKRQRLGTPMIRGEDGRLKPATWPAALDRISSIMHAIPTQKWRGVAGALADAESMVALKDLFNKAGAEDLVVDTSKSILQNDLRSSYIANSKFRGVEEADWILLIGTNPRVEAAVFNARIRRRWIYSDAYIGIIGPSNVALTFDAEHLGENFEVLDSLINGHSDFAKALSSAARPYIIVGSTVTERPDSNAVLGRIAELVSKHHDKFVQNDWNGVNILQRDASRVAAMDIGYNGISEKSSAPQLVYLLNADEYSDAVVPDDAFVIYQGHHGDRGAHRADVVLPGAAFTEKSATFVNAEGRAQRTYVAVPPPAAAREDWKIIRALSEVAGYPLAYDDIETLRSRMFDVSPTLTSNLNRVNSASFMELSIELWKYFAKGHTLSNVPVELPISDFYLTNPISRASQTMAKCSLEWGSLKENTQTS